MLQKLKQWVERRKQPKKVICSEQDMSMYTALTSIANKQHFAWVQMGSDERTYQSAIQSVNLDDRTLTLDEPFGLPDNFIWASGTSLTVVVKELPARMHFKSILLEHELDSVQNKIIVDWPENLEKQQRRAHFRLVFANYSDFEPCITVPELGEHWFSLKDLSVTGLAFGVENEWLEKFHPEMHFAQVNLHLSSQDVLPISLHVRRVLWHEESGSVEVAASFLNQSPQVQRVLEQFILFVQRKEHQNKNVA